MQTTPHNGLQVSEANLFFSPPQVHQQVRYAYCTAVRGCSGGIRKFHSGPGASTHC